MDIDIFLKKLESELPPIFTRNFISQKIGGIFSAKTLANVDCLGVGPSVKIKIGKKIGYERESFLVWLRTKMNKF